MKVLKIKDNVDLKELEKFGFKKYEDMYKKENAESKYSINQNLSVYKINCESRIIRFWGDDEYLYNFDTTLYKLIKANLIEEFNEVEE